MKIALDIDGVLADFITPFVKLLEESVGNGPIDLETLTDPNFVNYPHVAKETIARCIAEVSDNPRFWRDLAPLLSRPHWLALDQLSRDNRLVFITHRYERDHYSIHDVTCQWLVGHGVSKPVVYFTQTNKSELIEQLKVGLFVDDRQENCRDVAENTDAVVLMPDRHYNRTFTHPKVRRIRDLNGLFDYLESCFD